MMSPKGSERALTAAGQAFFAQLSRELVPEEETLIRLLRELGTAAASLLPRCVSIQDWAERRVPAELAVEVNASGLVYVKPNIQHKVSKPPPPVRPADPSTPAPPPPPSSKRLYPKAPVQPAPSPLERFLSSLPQDELSPLEETLRQTILQRLSKYSHISVANMQSNQWVRTAATAVLPADVPLEDWIQNRIGGEVGIDKHGTISLMVLPPKGERAQMVAEATRAFIADLPEDSFTEGELVLRSRVLHAMSTWKKSSQLTVGMLAPIPAVAAARRKCLPIMVSFSTWLEERMGKEISVWPLPSGQLAVGLAGEPDPGADQDPSEQWPEKKRRLG